MVKLSSHIFSANKITYPHLLQKNIDGNISTKISTPKINGQSHTVNLKVPKSFYYSAKEGEHQTRVPVGFSKTLWYPKSLKSFIFEEHHTKLYETILTYFRMVKIQLELDDNQYFELITGYVQNLPYDQEKVKSMALNPRFPIETIIDQKGICSDKSILLAALLQHEGYAVAILSFDLENHMTVGIPAPKGMDYKGTGYAVIETTAPSYIGDVNGKFDGGRSLHSNPVITPIGNGKLKYTAFNDTAYIISIKKRLEEITSGDMRTTIATNQKELQTEQKNGYENIDELNKNIDKLNEYIIKYNSYINLLHFISDNIYDRKAVINEIKKVLK